MISSFASPSATGVSTPSATVNIASSEEESWILPLSALFSAGNTPPGKKGARHRIAVERGRRQRQRDLFGQRARIGEHEGRIFAVRVRTGSAVRAGGPALASSGRRWCTFCTSNRYREFRPPRREWRLREALPPAKCSSGRDIRPPTNRSPPDNCRCSANRPTASKMTMTFLPA